MQEQPVPRSRPMRGGAKQEIADMIAERILSTLKTDLDKATLVKAIDIHARLGDVLAGSWRQSWKDGSQWKEATWKDGNCAKGELVSNPAEQLARLEQAMSRLREAGGAHS